MAIDIESLRGLDAHQAAFAAHGFCARAPTHEAVAVTGAGVFETLKTCSKLVLKSLG